jgi:teichuronic acid biosynthesis glycosyltransferase TuaG
MNDQPLVSVITPSYNSERFIEETIRSVQAQTYTNWEMIIVDDCSKDRTREIVKQYAEQDPRIRLIELTENSGAAVARNTALKAAKGKYAAFLDSDDIWLPQKLDKQISFMEERDIAFSFTQYRLMKVDGTLTDTVIEVPKEIDYKGLLKNTIIGNLTAVVNVEKTGQIQMPNIRTRQDFALWLSILKRGFKAYGIQEELAYYRLVPGSISSNKVKAAKQTWRVYREVEKLGLLYSSWCFLNYAWNAVKKTYLK